MTLADTPLFAFNEDAISVIVAPEFTATKDDVFELFFQKVAAT